ncbi:glycine receptor subunit alpha-3 [Plakobranchus ocellatus]|uniref:Glycine receptor subunit alpha-3 n=1 Tax=Plakobranchus ocellatus TaxID=259542 RepID=A0AAV4E284_9GAST|nr:glycine receptor subunit alpha-3 [Plakobranchus ocellatus]
MSTEKRTPRHQEPVSHNHFREEPQPLSPARRKVSFRTSAGPDTRAAPQEDVNKAPPNRPYLDHLSGHDVLVNPSPKPKKKARPKHFYESPRVHVRTVFMKIGEVDTVKEKFDADIFMQARWREPALDSHHPLKADVNWAETWNPSIVIQNLLDTRFDKTWHQLEVTSIGEAFVLEKRRVKGTFAENMELYDFPFDTQHLSLVLTAEECDVELVEDAREPSLVSHLSFVDEQEWQIKDLVECVPGNMGRGELGNLPPAGTMLLVRIHASRRAGFFFWNVLAITCLICSLILCTFSVSRDHPTNRLQLSFTIVLTTITFKFSANQNLPKVSYLTVLDKYMLSSIVLMHLVSVWHASICLAPSNDTTDVLDIAAFIVCVVAFLLIQVVFAIHIMQNIRGRRMILEQLQRQYEEKVNRVMGADYTVRKKAETSKRRLQRKFLPDGSVGAI